MTAALDSMTRRHRPLTNLAANDRVVLFPSLGHLARDNQHWVFDVHGDVFAVGQVSLGKRVLLKLLKRTMRASDEAFASPLFHQRIARFLAVDRPGRRIAVRIGERVHLLSKRTGRNGHFHGTLRLKSSELEACGIDPAAATQVVPLAVCGPDEEEVAAGWAHLIGRHGLSIISDIDDTLKHSFVACKRTLLQNTFLLPFETIPGMAGLFRRWEAQGAAFHYVSSSPWQLYEHLAEHLRDEGFPAGSYHLRAFRLRDHLLRRLLMLRRSGKATMVRALLRTFPQRRFLLVGDSGEHDPEIYGAAARAFPHQVAGVLIRELPGKNSTARRFEWAFRGVDPACVQLFRDAAELDADPRFIRSPS